MLNFHLCFILVKGKFKTINRMKKIFPYIFLPFIICSCGSNTPNSYIKCNFEKAINWDFVLDFNRLIVKDLTLSPNIRTGRLIVEDDRYIFDFPAEKKGAYEMLLIINRTSGISSVEQGVPPFTGEYRLNNSLMHGSCKKVKSNPL